MANAARALANRVRRAAGDDAKPRYLAAVVYAYVYLFGKETAGALDPYDPRFRMIADLYNRSLSEFLKTSRRGDALIESGTHELPFATLLSRRHRL